MLLHLAFVGLVNTQVRALATPLTLARESFSTVQGGKEVVVSAEGTLEIKNSFRNDGTHPRPFRYSSSYLFLYMMPLGAQDQPDRLLTVWESPDSITQIIVFSLLSHPQSNDDDPRKGRILLKESGIGLPSLINIRDAEILVMSQRPARLAVDSADEVCLVYLWDGIAYRKYATATPDRIWSILKSADSYLEHRNDQKPIIVKP